MEFNEFREKVKEALPDFLTDNLRNAEIKDTAVNKLQGESYSGISVTPEGSRVGVSINLEDAFLDYQTGSQFTAVMNGLADNIVGTLGEQEQFDLGFLEDYRAVKDMLTVEVVGKDQNAEILQSVPHQELEDLATVYRIALGETENGNATVLITNKILRNYGITQDQLHQDALDAAQHTMKYSIRSMDEVLREMAQSMGIEQNQPVMANILFLVIDMQNGFINNFTEDLVPKILDFQAKIRDSVLTAGTRYVNHEHTACYMFEGWKNCMAGTKEAEIAPALRGCMARVFDKDKYSCWNEEMKAEEGNAIHTFRRNGITVKFHSKTGRRICMFPGNLTSTERKTWRGLPAKKGSYCG